MRRPVACAPARPGPAPRPPVRRLRPPHGSRRLDGIPFPRYSGSQGACPAAPWRWRMAASARHETRALLRAHLAAASGYRHLTRHCPVCHQLLRLAMEPAAPAGGPEKASPGGDVLHRPAPKAPDGDPTAGAADAEPADTARGSPLTQAAPPATRRERCDRSGTRFSAAAQTPTRTLVCDGCHRIRFLENRGTYPPPTTWSISYVQLHHHQQGPPHRQDPTARPQTPTRPLTDRPHRRTDPRTKRSRWTRRSPARSTTHPVATRNELGRGPCWGRTRVAWSCRFGRHDGLGGPASSPGYSVVQASLRCCGMPASSARTSASR